MGMYRWIVVGVAVVWLLSGMVTPLRAQQNPELQKRIETLEKQLQELKDELKRQAGAVSRKEAESQARTKTLGEELESLRLKVALPETKELKGQYGLGPAASKVYGVERGLSLGAYGQSWLQHFFGDGSETKKDVFDYKRFVLYAGYKFTDRILFNSEIEFEHATTGSTESAGSGSASVEFAALDFFLWEPLNIRAGMLLVPFGFLNEVHEPLFYFGNERPEVERQIIPSTWRENGAGFFGTLFPGFEYRTYLVTSLNAKGFKKNNIRSARQKGNRAFAEDFTSVTRVDYSPESIPGFLIGSSVHFGDTGQGQKFGGRSASAHLLMYEFHAQYRYRGLHLRGLYVRGDIDNADILSADPEIKGPISHSIWGYYLEAAYDLLPWLLPGTKQSLSPFYRYERFNTQEDVPRGFTPDPFQNRTVNTFGVNYKPHPNVVIKGDLRIFDSQGGDLADEVNIGFGFAF